MLESYPHPAVIELLTGTFRFPYKVARMKRYWPALTASERRVRLVATWEVILQALAKRIDDVNLVPPTVGGLAALKGFEDALDALVSAWVGIRYLDGAAIAFGDNTSAIWVPKA